MADKKGNPEGDTKPGTANKTGKKPAIKIGPLNFTSSKREPEPDKPTDPFDWTSQESLLESFQKAYAELHPEIDGVTKTMPTAKDARIMEPYLIEQAKGCEKRVARWQTRNAERDVALDRPLVANPTIPLSRIGDSLNCPLMLLEKEAAVDYYRLAKWADDGKVPQLDLDITTFSVGTQAPLHQLLIKNWKPDSVNCAEAFKDIQSLWPGVSEVIRDEPMLLKIFKCYQLTPLYVGFFYVPRFLLLCSEKLRDHDDNVLEDTKKAASIVEDTIRMVHHLSMVESRLVDGFW